MCTVFMGKIIQYKIVVVCSSYCSLKTKVVLNCTEHWKKIRIRFSSYAGIFRSGDDVMREEKKKKKNFERQTIHFGHVSFEVCTVNVGGKYK